MSAQSGTQLSILLVERNEDVRELFASVCTQLGFHVDTVKTGAEAIAVARGRAPHAVYSSLMLEDMHGFHLCRMLRSLPALKHTVFIALTGYSAPNIEKESKEAGFNHYLLKPVSLATMFAPLHSVPGLEAGGAFHDAYAALTQARIATEE